MERGEEEEQDYMKLAGDGGYPNRSTGRMKKKCKAESKSFNKTANVPLSCTLEMALEHPQTVPRMVPAADTMFEG